MLLEAPLCELHGSEATPPEPNYCLEPGHRGLNFYTITQSKLCDGLCSSRFLTNTPDTHLAGGRAAVAEGGRVRGSSSEGAS